MSIKFKKHSYICQIDKMVDRPTFFSNLDFGAAHHPSTQLEIQKIT